MFSSPVSISASSGTWRDRRLAGRRAFGRAVADLGAVDPGDARRQHRLDRARQMIVEAGLGRPVIGAKAQHDADLVGLHAVEAARQPERDDRRAAAMATQLPVPKPPGGSTRRNRSWLRRSRSSKSGGCGRARAGPGRRHCRGRRPTGRRRADRCPRGHRPDFARTSTSNLSAALRSGRAREARSPRRGQQQARPDRGRRAGVVKSSRPPQIPHIRLRRCPLATDRVNRARTEPRRTVASLAQAALRTKRYADYRTVLPRRAGE